MSAGTLPVGTVLAYAGAVPGDLVAAGWLLCDGASYGAAERRELYDAIGFAFGRVTSNPPVFNVPDLRGRFIRCTADAATRDERDPDWRQRSALLAGGHDRADVGSYQQYGTAPPRVPCTSSVNRADVSKERDDAGCGPVVAQYSTETVNVSLLGGDLESRPVNKNVHFVMKARSDAALPLGTVLAFAGPDAPVPDVWLLCDGSELPQVGPYRALFDAIRHAHGRSENGEFLLPDYRGWFLRGVSNPTSHDPDRARRTPPAEGGAGGDAVGSAQRWATGLPTDPARPARVAFANLPQSDRGKSIAGAVRHVALRNSGSAPVTFYASGGDRETRPANVSVDFYIVGRVSGATVPVGTIVTTGGPVPADDGWQPCDGRLLTAADHPALVTALGYRWAGDTATGIRLPDLRGRFLRGADRGTGVDPDAKQRTPCGIGKPEELGSVQPWATAPPGNPFTASVPYLPTDSRQVHGETRGDVAGSGSAKAVTLFNGGNADSRPANVYLNAYIRVR